MYVHSFSSDFTDSNSILLTNRVYINILHSKNTEYITKTSQGILLIEITLMKNITKFYFLKDTVCHLQLNISMTLEYY